MCLHKSVTNVLQYWLSRERYLRNMDSEICHSKLAKQNSIIKYSIDYLCASDLSVCRLSLFLACLHLISEKNLRECEAQSWFDVQAVLQNVFAYPLRCPRMISRVRVTQAADNSWRRPEENKENHQGLRPWTGRNSKGTRGERNIRAIL
jgi:hypothetical protein